jgi:hypothetical protein
MFANIVPIEVVDLEIPFAGHVPTERGLPDTRRSAHPQHVIQRDGKRLHGRGSWRSDDETNSLPLAPVLEDN